MLDFKTYKVTKLQHRYITNDHIEPLLNQLKAPFEVNSIGRSVNGLPIYSVTIGNGPKRILMWSQMHGNESTTTKALFDFFNVLSTNVNISTLVLERCTMVIIPILNPDGAQKYTRVNANAVDLNRDAVNRSQPESKVLRKLIDTFKPNYCFNLHGQRTIFSAGYANESSILSFLSPAQDKQRAITSTRKIAMEIIVEIAKSLRDSLPNSISRYDDGFNINCVGDTCQSLNIPTLLFEAGHVPGDYGREQTRDIEKCD